jgi:hypothetical protein
MRPIDGATASGARKRACHRDAAALLLAVERDRRTEPLWLLSVYERERPSMTFVDRDF